MEERIDISIVIPAFNEESRLPHFLERIIAHCQNSPKIYEIIVVDDASSDDTPNIAQSYRSRFNNLRLVKIRRNRGKGYAVKRGLLQAKGEFCLFMDADGSVGPEEIEKNLAYLVDEDYDLLVGSRALYDEDQVLKVRWYRKLIGMVFNWCVQSFLFKDIQDTQCGFKIFRRQAIKPIFSRSYLRGFGFDIEILYLASKMGYKVKEVPVSWQHMSGSKVNLVLDSIKMFFNILQVRNWHCTEINPAAEYLGPDEYRYMYEMEGYHWWFLSRAGLVLELIESLGKINPVILDAGAGTGLNLSRFSKFGESFGIDISEQAVEFCRRRGLTNVKQAALEQTDFSDKSFDIITCLDVLEHTSNPVTALQELGRLLKDDGKIILTVPAYRLLWSQHDDALCHLRRYEKESLICDLDEAGLQEERTGFFFFTSFFAVAPIRLLRRLLAGKGKAKSDTTSLPPKILNEVLKFVCGWERKFALKFGLPFGTTLYAIVSRKR